MDISLLVPESGYSFINQAQALAKGFIALGHQAKVVREPDAGATIAIGSWVHYRELVEGPTKAGFRVVPWLVSDDHVDTFHEELNSLPLLLTTSKHCQSIFLRDGITTKIEIIPEAVDDEFWKPQTVDEIRPIAEFLSIREAGMVMPQKFDLVKLKADGVPILFTTGGDATSKGAQEVMQALNPALPWMYLLKTWPGARSLRCSADELDLANQLGIRDRIRYVIGEYSREFLRGLMNLCDIYVSPSRSEGFGLPLIEAQLCGKPAVGSSANASGETIRDGKTGFVVNADIGQLILILTKLISEEPLRKKLGHAARIHAQETYNPNKIAQRFLDIL
jgi:glycosyltransferase involved in cell wall biosynthesis